MFIDARTLPDATELVVDTAIVGAGPAGVAVATRLAGDRRPILVIESGGRKPRSAPQLAAGDASRPYYDLAEARLRGLGGSTAAWGGWCDRLQPSDVEGRAWIPNSAWPLRYDELARYYRDADAFCGIPADFADTRGWGGLTGGADAAFEATAFPVLGTRNLGRYHASRFDEPDLDLLTHATVTDIVVSDHGRRVDRLLVRSTGAGRIHVVARTVVLATGGIENARLLLAASSPPWPDGIGNGHGLVGRYFMEHPHVDAVRVHNTNGCEVDLGYFEPRPTRGRHGVQTCGALTLSGATCSAEQVGGAQVFLEPAGLHLNSGRPAIRDGRRPFAPDYASPRAGELAVVVVSEQVPNPESRVALSSERDRYGVPRPYLRWNLTELDHRTVAVAKRHAVDLVRRLGMTGLRARFRRDRWPRDTIGGPHHLGTTRMAARERDGVVNEDCRVHGLDNLFVAGGSVFPSCGYAPPTLTIVALALRLGDHLRQINRTCAG